MKSPKKTDPPQKTPSALRERIILGMTCFLSGGAILVIELAGNRLLAPIFGNSLYTWTGLISIILLAISLGDYLGGWMVDRNPRFILISRVLFLAAGFVFLIPAIVPWFSHNATKWSILWGPLIVAVLLFAAPAILLATVTPIAIRLLSKTMGDQHIGISAGTIGMLASLGSFTGTLLAGFVLIPMIGVRELYWVVGGLITLLAILHLFLMRDEEKKKNIPTLAILFCVAAPLMVFFFEDARISAIIFQKDTFYHLIRVVEKTGEANPERVLTLDNTVEGGQRFPSGEITFAYQKYWQLSEAFPNPIRRAVFFGAGAFAMPQHLSRLHPEIPVDVVEIDPEVIRVGKQFFALGDYEKIIPHAMDARRFLSHTPDGTYDYIFGDAYHGMQYVPNHLLTQEFFELVKSKLTPDGVYAMNFIGALQGKKSEVFLHVLATLRSAFPEVQVYPLYPYSPEVAQNLILVAARHPLAYRPDLSPELRNLLHNRLKDLPSTDHITLLTDNYCPVEYLIAKQLQ
ncbi:MAG: fused MFS/spermidine synthase [Chthoniobacterales bacterium]